MRLLVLALLATAAHGAILTYYLHDARIGGGEAVGAFAFDTDTARLTLPNLTPGANLDALTNPINIPVFGYAFFPALGGGDPSLLLANDARSRTSIHLAFAVPLGGSVAPLNLADSYVRLSELAEPRLYFTSGFASTSAPEPGTWLAALSALVVLVRRQR